MDSSLNSASGSKFSTHYLPDRAPPPLRLKIQKGLTTRFSPFVLLLQWNGMLLKFFGYIKGSGFGVLEDREIKLDVGETFIARAGTLHSLRSDGDLSVNAFPVPAVDG